MSDNGKDTSKGANLNFNSSVRSPPANQQKDIQKLELSFIELNKERAKQKEWKKLIRDLVFQRGKIPLLLAVEAGNQSMVRELLSAQTAEQLKATTPAGETALHLAARRRDVDMARILVDYGAAVDATNGAGQTPLHIAAAEGDEPLVKYFYGVRANAAIADNEDRTPMHLAAENGHAAIIELLADKFKASIFERTKDGSTLMHIASLNGHADCAMMLFKKGVYLHMPNKDSLPQPPFENIFEANNDSAVCPQKEEFNKTLIGTLDCLTLNIYVPNSVSSQNKLPVLIHIYGGEFKIGFAGRYIYGPKYLVRHDIILVLFNYRLGPYGFFCCTNPECSGNQGLKDQKKAIKWVHDNIDSFGGDPNKITIAGHSSGATSLDLLLHSLSANEKLFDKAIFQSGMMNIPEIMRAPNDKVVLEIANSLNLKTDCFNNALNFLSTVDPKLLIETTVALNISVRSCIEQKFDNVEHYLTDHIINLDIPIIKGMPILIGNTDNERLYMYENRKPDYFDDLNVFYEELSNNFELDNDTVNQFEKQIRNFYMGERKISMKTKEEITDYTSDFYYYHPTRRSMSKYLKNGAKNVFYYIFAYTGNRNFLKSRFNITKPGAVHADEIGYLFDISYMNKNPTPEDQLIIDRMTTLWANFIKYGNPTPERTELLPVKWQPYTKESEHYLNIDTHLSLNTRPFPHRMAFWDMFYELNAKYQIHYKDNINN